MRFTKLTPILAISSLALACTESPTGIPPDEAPLFDQASGGSWVAMISGAGNGFENGTGIITPGDEQRLDHNTTQIHAKLYGDGSVKGSITLMRKRVGIDGEPGNNQLMFHVTQSSVTCLEVDGNKAWVGYVIEKPIEFSGAQLITQFVLESDAAWQQNIFAPASSCVDKPDLENMYRWDMGSMKIVDRR